MVTRRGSSRSSRQQDSAYVLIVGRVGKDPEEVDGKKGPFTVFSVATDDLPEKAEDADAAPLWVSILVFDEDMQDAVFADDGVQKGMRIAVEGGLGTEEYKGETQYKVFANRIHVLEVMAEKAPKEERSTRSRRSSKDDDEEDEPEEKPARRSSARSTRAAPKPASRGRSRASKDEDDDEDDASFK
jgi:single stranded DNA-binding protein